MMDQASASEARRRTGASSRSGFVALACGAFVMAAVLLEVIAGGAANSPVPAWAQGLFPLTWPQPARVLWWLVVAAAALTFRLVLVRLGLARHNLLTVAIVAPFVILAAGVAFGADWATWH